MAVTEYQVLESTTVAEMATLAAAAIAAGWQPTGGVGTRKDDQYPENVYITQAFIKGSPATAFFEALSLDQNKLSTEAGAGITGGSGTVYKSSVVKMGGIIRTSILIDLTGLSSSTTDLDIIGVGASVAHLGRITAADCGTVLTGRLTCLEVPVGGADDIDLYSATEGTGVFDGAVASLTETALLTSGGAWTLALTKALGALPAANEYLYLTGGEAGTAAPYTAGKFLLELEGYAA